MRMRNWLVGTLVGVLGVVPMGAQASAACPADAEISVAPLALFSPRFALLQPSAALDDNSLAALPTGAAAFRFQLMSPVLNSDKTGWQMPAGRYWYSLELGEAKATQEGIDIPADTIESWLLAPVDSLAVPF